ncbi:MAG TPA: hypothetical protein VFJ02_03550 [Vicinamibacterales bacterium]|nr:hypothetical protein [Vicinamibacterales bacterium]
MDATASLMALLGLGAFHGINPGMGWLFAVALGLQERRRGAVWRALLPLALGHSLAVAAAVAIALALGLVLSIEHLRWPVGLGLLALGASRVARHRHPRWAAMRVRMARLTLWSFLMASAHGAGLMVVPVFAGMSAGGQLQCHVHPASATIGAALLATGVHGLGYVLVTAIVSVLVFEKFGVGILRTAWVNIDLVWALALVGTGVFTLLS